MKENNYDEVYSRHRVSEEGLWDTPLWVLLLTIALAIGAGWLVLALAQQVVNVARDANIPMDGMSWKFVLLTFLSVGCAAVGIGNLMLLCRNISAIMQKMFYNRKSKNTFKFRNNG